MSNNINNNIFEIATRNMFRFSFKGMINVEDLWQLSVKDLDDVFKILNSQLKKANEESLLSTKTKQDKELDMKIEIVKYIVGIKLEEENLRLKAKENKEQKQKILEVLASKRDQNLLNKSEEELTKMLNELDS